MTANNWLLCTGVIGALLCPTVDAASSAGTATSSAHQSQENPEEARVERAVKHPSLAGHPLLSNARFEELAPTKISNRRLTARARAAGTALWRRARSAQAVTPASATAERQSTPDDRLLYWNRLQQKRIFRTNCAAPADCAGALQAFELASRGFNDMAFKRRSGKRLRIALTGFDPFGLDSNLLQSNPSGATALALDGTLLPVGNIEVQIQSALFPVRFADFDEAVVENLFEPLIRQNQIDMLITVSMGRSNFDLERFPGRRRSASATDNLQVLTGASKANPLVPTLHGAPLTGPEFVEFSLPAAAMQKAQGRYLINDNRTVQTLTKAPFEAQSLAALGGMTAVSGSGGGYLSNEISYRTVSLAQRLGSNIVVGHIHTPRIESYDPGAIHAIRQQIERMLIEAVVAR